MAAAAASALPDDDSLRNQWKELARQYEDRPRLASMLSSGKINILEEAGVKIIDFIVLNEAQKQWELESKIRTLRRCNQLRIEVSVVPAEEVEKKPYMPEEKAKDLIEKNPEVRAFVADLGLDTK